MNVIKAALPVLPRSGSLEHFMKNAFENIESPLVQCRPCSRDTAWRAGSCPPGGESSRQGGVSTARLCEAVQWQEQRVVPGLQGVVLLQRGHLCTRVGGSESKGFLRCIKQGDNGKVVANVLNFWLARSKRVFGLVQKQTQAGKLPQMFEE